MRLNVNASPQSFGGQNATGQVFLPFQRGKQALVNAYYDLGSTQQITVQTFNGDSMAWRIDRIVLTGTAPIPFDVGLYIGKTTETGTAAIADFLTQTDRKSIVPQDELFLMSNEYLTVQFQSLDSGGGFFCGFNLFYTAGHFVQTQLS